MERAKKLARLEQFLLSKGIDCKDGKIPTASLEKAQAFILEFDPTIMPMSDIRDFFRTYANEDLAEKSDTMKMKLLFRKLDMYGLLEKAGVLKEMAVLCDKNGWNHLESLLSQNLTFSLIEYSVMPEKDWK